jgi:hypothetical protein
MAGVPTSCMIRSSREQAMSTETHRHNELEQQVETCGNEIANVGKRLL